MLIGGIKNKKIIIGIIAVILIVFIGLFLSTGGARTDVNLRNYQVSEDGKTMTIIVDLISSAGYIRDMKQKNDNGNYYLTFYSTFGINSKLGAKDTFTLELDSNVDEIYFFKGNKGYNKVLEKNKEAGEWNIVKNVDSNKYEDYKKVSTLHSNGETNIKELLNAKVDSMGETTLVLNYNNTYELYEIIEE